MIEVLCFTNIDAYLQQHWPKAFVCPPSIGEKVRSEQGKILKIVDITHCERVDRYGTKEAFLMVELNHGLHT